MFLIPSVYVFISYIVIFISGSTIWVSNIFCFSPHYFSVFRYILKHNYKIFNGCFKGPCLLIPSSVISRSVSVYWFLNFVIVLISLVIYFTDGSNLLLISSSISFQSVKTNLSTQYDGKLKTHFKYTFTYTMHRYMQEHAYNY